MKRTQESTPGLAAHPPLRPLLAAGSLLAAVLAVAPSTASAQAFPELGGRAFAMGGAYVALATGPSALYWNPAGMALTGPSSSFVYGRLSADPEGLTERLDDLGATEAASPDITDRLADALRAVELLGAIAAEPDAITAFEPVGAFYSGGRYGGGFYRLTSVEAAPLVDTTHVGLSDDPATGLAFNDSRLRLRRLDATELVGAMAGQIGDPRLLVGLSARWTRGKTRIATPSLLGFDDFHTWDVVGAAGEGEEETSDDFSFDVGALLTAHPKLRFGVMGKYLGQPEFDAADGTKVVIEPRWRTGLAILASPSVSISADVDLTRTGFGPDEASSRLAAAGLEVTLAEGKVALRGGYRDAIEGRDRRLLSGGIGFFGKGMMLDLGVGYSPNTSSPSFSLEFGYRAPSR